MRDLDALFTGVLLATGPRPVAGFIARHHWRKEVRYMLAETVGKNESAARDLYMVYSEWLTTRENHANLQRL